MASTNHFIHLELDGKILLIDHLGKYPAIPQLGRMEFESTDGWLIRLPTPKEAAEMGLTWEEKRTNRFKLGDGEYTVLYATPSIPWPEDWAWKDAVISDSAAHPVIRESVYRTMPRLVTRVVLQNESEEVLMGKVARGFFAGKWTMTGGYLDYAEHPRVGAVRETKEELGIDITIPKPFSGETESLVDLGKCPLSRGFEYVSDRIFTQEGLQFISHSYLVKITKQTPFTIKSDEIREVRWMTVDEALELAASWFDIEVLRLLK